MYFHVGFNVRLIIYPFYRSSLIVVGERVTLGHARLAGSGTGALDRHLPMNQETKIDNDSSETNLYDSSAR
jgi:hypothetical protein